MRNKRKTKKKKQRAATFELINLSDRGHQGPNVRCDGHRY